jgi:hypothetical protein
MQGQVFVVMPFRDESEDLWDFGIRPAVEELGWQCTRADTAIASPGFIVAQIYEQISRADVVIGEMTGQNPNVFYEIGFAHALGKPTLLLAKSGADLTAFDTRGFQHAFHGSRIENVRRIVASYLSALDSGNTYEPTAPGAEVLYEWPSPEFEDPYFTWRSEEKNGRSDVNGGQSIEPVLPVGRVIRVRETGRLWNWRRGGSIMRLVKRTSKIAPGDKVYLSVVARVDAPTVVGFIGDGGRVVREERKEDWSRVWKDTEFKLRPAPVWQSTTIAVSAEPTIAGYDSKARGATLYVTCRTDKGVAEVRRIRVLHAHGKAARNTGPEADA